MKKKKETGRKKDQREEDAEGDGIHDVIRPQHDATLAIGRLDRRPLGGVVLFSWPWTVSTSSELSLSLCRWEAQATSIVTPAW